MSIFVIKGHKQVAGFLTKDVQPSRSRSSAIQAQILGLLPFLTAAISLWFDNYLQREGW